jgi:hypothetical protein
MGAGVFLLREGYWGTLRATNETGLRPPEMKNTGEAVNLCHKSETKCCFVTSAESRMAIEA